MKYDSKSILEIAIAEEKKASRFYSNLALQMEDAGAKLKFEIMSATEQKHFEQLLSYYQKKFQTTPEGKDMGEGIIVRPEMLPTTASFEEAVRVIMDTERKAWEFYKKAFETATDENDRKIFNSLAQMEQAHYEQFRTEYNFSTETTIRFASEDIPWMLEVF
jgi:rubrerythrin